MKHSRIGQAALFGLAVVSAAALGGCGGHKQPSPVQMAAAVTPPAAPIEPSAYKVQLGDELDIKFLFQPDMNTHVIVRPDGKVSTPVAGEIEAVNMTTPELEKIIVERSKHRLRNPEVTVIVTKLGEQRVYVGGEVWRPSYVPLRPDMTPLQAIIEVGGFKASAKLNSVILITPGSDGRFTALKMDMEQVVEQGVPERVRLTANSIVFVPQTWIAEADVVVDQWVRGLFPALPKVGAGVQIQ